jgi:hypothetical protein
LIFTKALLVRLRPLWFVASIISSLWFLYWICYDVLVWNKALTQAAPANYAGLIVSLVLAIVCTQLGKLGISEKPMLPPEQNVHKKVNQTQKASEGERVQPVKQIRQIQPAEEETIQIPPGAMIPPGCKFYLGYLHERPESVEIPEECLECEHVVECLSPTAHTIEQASN